MQAGCAGCSSILVQYCMRCVCGLKSGLRPGLLALVDGLPYSGGGGCRNITVVAT